MRILAGLTKPSYGKALYKNKSFYGVNPGISIVFQTFALYPWLTVLENVELGLSYTLQNNNNNNSIYKESLRTRTMKTINNIGSDG